MAYNLQKRKERNMAEESETDDDDDGKIVIYLNMYQWVGSYLKSAKGISSLILYILIYQIFKPNLPQARPAMYRNAKRERKMNLLLQNLRNKLSRIRTKMKSKVLFLLFIIKSTIFEKLC